MKTQKETHCKHRKFTVYNKKFLCAVWNNLRKSSLFCNLVSMCVLMMYKEF
jgi:hypothetical protein